MDHLMRRSAELAIAFCLAAMTQSAEAGIFASNSSPAEVRVYEAALTDGNLASVGKCCGTRCITYRSHGRRKRICCDCAPPTKAVLHVKDPCA